MTGMRLELMQLLLGVCIACCHILPLCSACPAECVCSAASQAVICNPVTNAFNEYSSSIPAWAYRLILVCQPQLSATGRPLPIGPALSSFSPGIFRRFSELREVTLRSCPIAALPAELFASLPLLETVTLDNLPLGSLPPGLFRGSRSLRDLVILRSPEYRAQPPGLFIDTAGPRLLRLVETSLNGDAFANLLASVSPGTLTHFELKMTADPPLTLAPNAFARFNLSSLGLSNNGIVRFDFLPSAGSAIVTLSYNPVPAGRLAVTEAAQNSLVATLHLEHMALAEIPDGLAAAFPNLAELYLASNVISELAPDRLENLSKLVRLDLSANRIQTLSNWRSLQPLLRTILYRDRVAGQVYLADNPVHCNCELAWIYDTPLLSSSLFKDLTCASGQFPGQLLARVQKHQLRCLAPSAPAIVTVGGNSSTSDALPGSAAAVLLAPGQNVTLTCNSTGDPAPDLSWRRVLPGSSAQELVRSRQSKDFTALTTVLVLSVAHGWVPAGRQGFECAATSPYFAELRANVTLVVMETDSPDTTAGPRLVGTPGPSVKWGSVRRSLPAAVLTAAAAATYCRLAGL